MPYINDKLKDLNAKRLNDSRSNLSAGNEVGAVAVAVNHPPRKARREVRFRFDVDQVMQRVRSRIFGQDEILGRIESMLKIVWADITEAERPLYVAMFLGPTGVGKTEIIKVLAEAIHGESGSFSRVDMNTLSQEHYAAALTGAPPGYVGSREGSTILDKEQVEGSFSKPGIVLFDEVEKASQEVLQSLLNVFDNGKLVMTSGEQTIDFCNTMVFMTSNLGAQEIFESADKKFAYFLKRVMVRMNPAHWGNKEENPLKTLVHKQLEKNFSPEFINRIDDIVVFNWLDKNTLRKVLDSLVEQLNRRLKKHQCELQLDESAKAFLLQKGFDRHYGARALKRVVRTHLEALLAAVLMDRSADEEFAVYLAKQDGNTLKIE